MTTAGAYDLVLTPPARHALTDRLPQAVATAVIEFITTALVQEPRRVGKPLRGDLEGIWADGYQAARRAYELGRTVRQLRGHRG